MESPRSFFLMYIRKNGMPSIIEFIREFLKNHSYEFAAKLTRWGESLWVHTDYKASMNWTVLQEFGYPLG